ncbi:MAG: cytochrome c3 family protein, partial [Thermodesulfobacteriota bacterium]
MLLDALRAGAPARPVRLLLADRRAALDPVPRDRSRGARDQPAQRPRAGAGGCTQCHAELGAEARLVAHTRHAAGSPGSRCYNCHMPNTAYGLQKATRSHEITSPSVVESAEVGRPNACNLCHLDRTLAWTADELER